MILAVDFDLTICSDSSFGEPFPPFSHNFLRWKLMHPIQAWKERKFYPRRGPLPPLP